MQVCTHLGRGCVSVLRSGHMKVCGMGLYVGGGADVCVSCQRPGRMGSLQRHRCRGVWGIHNVQDKTMNGRRNKSESCYFPAV